MPLREPLGYAIDKVSVFAYNLNKIRDMSANFTLNNFIEEKKTVKKFCKALAVMLLLVAAFTVLTACHGVKKIDEFKEDLENAESLTFKFHTADYVSEINYLIKIDGNKAYIESSFAGNLYTEIKDGYLYTYSETANGWTRDSGILLPETSLGSDPRAQLDFDEFLKGDNYEYSRKDKAYVAKEGAAALPFNMNGVSVSYLELSLKGNDCVAKATINLKGFVKDVTLWTEITDVNSTVVLLPDTVN